MITIFEIVCFSLVVIFGGLAIMEDDPKVLKKFLICGILSLLIGFILIFVENNTSKTYAVIRTYESYNEYTLLILQDKDGKLYEVYSEDYYAPGEVLTLFPSDISTKKIKVLNRGQSTKYEE